MDEKKYTLEDIETLKNRTGITYEEAISLLEKYDGDIARCLVELEKRGKIEDKKGFDLGETLTDLWQKGCAYRIVLEKGERTICDLPVIYMILALLVGWRLVLVSAIIALVAGVKVRLETPEGGKPAPEAPVREEPAPVSNVNDEEEKKDDGYKSVTIE